MIQSLNAIRKASLATYEKRISAEFRLLANNICAPNQTSVTAVLFYGSCLHQPSSSDSLADFYIIVSSYKDFWKGKKWLQIAGKLLPPNVFYRELELSEGKVRCKYAVLSMADFEAGCTTWFHTYVFGRFAQPVALMHCDQANTERIIHALSRATERFLDTGLSLMTAPFDSLAPWREALIRSYSCELRPERAERIDVLIGQARDYFQNTAEAYLRALNLEPMPDGRWCPHTASDVWSRTRWMRRKIWGKCLSLLRLMKAFFTFENGIDYIIYKLERHTNEDIQVPDRVRKWPLIFLWELFFRLWCRRLFR